MIHLILPLILPIRIRSRRLGCYETCHESVITPFLPISVIIIRCEEKRVCRHDTTTIVPLVYIIGQLE